MRVIPYGRVWLFLLPIYIGLASSGVIFLLSQIKPKISHYNTVLAITLSVWSSWNVIHSQPKGISDNFEQTTIFFKDYLKQGDRVLAEANPDPSLIYYFKRYNVPVKYLVSIWTLISVYW